MWVLRFVAGVSAGALAGRAAAAVVAAAAAKNCRRDGDTARPPGDWMANIVGRPRRGTTTRRPAAARRRGVLPPGRRPLTAEFTRVDRPVAAPTTRRRPRPGPRSAGPGTARSAPTSRGP